MGRDHDLDGSVHLQSLQRTVTSGADGVTESQLYPVTSGSPGNWGTINVGVSNNSTSVLGAQIRYGITPAQLATFPNSTIALDTTQTPPSITFSGNPGISAGIKDDLTAHHRQAALRPDLRSERGQREQRLVPRDRVPAVPDPQRQFPGEPQVCDHPALPDERPDRRSRCGPILDLGWPDPMSSFRDEPVQHPVSTESLLRREKR